MKIFKSSVVFVTALFLLVLSASPLQAHAFKSKKTWGTSTRSTLTISGVGSVGDTTYGTCVFNTNKTFLLKETENGKTRQYKGTYLLNNSRSKFDSIKLNNSGISSMKKMLIDWVKEFARDGGVSISSVSISISSVSITKSSVNKVTGRPNKTRVLIKGKVSANVDGSRQTAAFKYTNYTSFY